MPRSETLYLQDILKAVTAIQAYLAEVSHAGWVEDDMRQHAVLQRLTEIGEAASHLSPGTRAEIHEVEWRDVVAFRNIAVHAYFSVDWDVVWYAATHDAPKVGQAVVEFLNQPDRPAQ